MTDPTSKTAMAKRSFLLHTSQYDGIQLLTIEQKGRLLDCIFQHAMGEAVTIDDDPVLNMAFAFIKESMTYNKERYDEIVEKRRAAGRRGANKRWNNSDGNQSIANDGKNGNCYQDVANMANIAYTDTDAVAVTDTVADTDADTDTHPLKSVCDKSNIARTDGPALLDRFFAPGQAAQVEQLAMTLATTPDCLRTLAEEVVNDWQLSETTHADYRDASTHLMSTIRRKLDYQRTHPTPGQPDTADDPTLSDDDRARLARIDALLRDNAPRFRAATPPMSLAELNALAELADSRGLGESHLARAMREVENKVAAAANAGRPCPYGLQAATLTNFLEKLRP